jgi:alkylation response protein AidB-like acyl-CoA dehydrogenase
MDLDLNEDQRMIRDRVRSFLQGEIAPVVEQHERERRTITKDIIRKLGEFGFASALVPEESGGLGLDATSYCIMMEELSRVWGSLRTLVSTSGMATRVIAKKGSCLQKGKFLPRLMAMEETACFALTEPNVGSDASAVQTRATRTGEGYVLNGTKTLITGGSMADIILVYAQAGEVGARKGITALLVRRDESEVQARDIRKMGLRCAPLSELVFVETHVPVENRLGEEGEGLRIALSELNLSRINVAFAVIGAGQAALDAAVRYTKERVQFGRPISSFQLVQEMIVEMALKVYAARLLAYRAAQLMDRGVDCRREASFAKLYATEAMLDVTSKAIQVHGGYGYTEEFPVERYYRDIRHLTMAEGTSEIQKLALGRDILGTSAFV